MKTAQLWAIAAVKRGMTALVHLLVSAVLRAESVVVKKVRTAARAVATSRFRLVSREASKATSSLIGNAGQDHLHMDLKAMEVSVSGAHELLGRQ